MKDYIYISLFVMGFYVTSNTRVVKKDRSSSLKLKSRSRHLERRRREQSAEGTRGGVYERGYPPLVGGGTGGIPRKFFEIYIAGGGFWSIFEHFLVVFCHIFSSLFLP